MTALRRSEFDSLHFPSEATLEPVVERFMRDRGYSHIGREVGFYDLRVDLYGYSPARKLTVAVELKLSRWRRALVQALQYQLCADITYIALPASTASRIDIGQLSDQGIGLLSVTRYRCDEMLPPRPKEHVRADYRDRMIMQLQEERANEHLTA